MHPEIGLRPSAQHTATISRESHDGPVALRFTFPDDDAKYDWMEEDYSGYWAIREEALARRVACILWISPGCVDGLLLHSRVLPDGDTEFFYDSF
jgi:hypothetical protein